ncbi:hypothetical protein NCCP28_23950 [Niallia sp. NCCP-28]|nr:GTP-binding protein [Niallia sp. NCCP-28]GKU82999.1 hypothetical protein NCCP28_23950 [Niallia sp. NCCP-28]
MNKTIGISAHVDAGKTTFSEQLLYLSDPKKTTASTSKTTTYSLPTGVYKKRHKGNGVKQLQVALNKLNFNCGTLDGIFGGKNGGCLKTVPKCLLQPGRWHLWS